MQCQRVAIYFVVAGQLVRGLELIVVRVCESSVGVECVYFPIPGFLIQPRSNNLVIHIYDAATCASENLQPVYYQEIINKHVCCSGLLAVFII